MKVQAQMILILALTSFLNVLGQKVEVVKQLDNARFKIAPLFGNESYLIDVSRVEFSLLDTTTQKIDKSTSNQFSIIRLFSSKSKVDGVDYGGATGTATLFGATVNTSLNKNEDYLQLNKAQSNELKRALNKMFVAYEKLKMDGSKDFLVRVETSFGLALTNDGQQIGLEYEGEIYLVEEEKLWELYGVVSKVN